MARKIQLIIGSTREGRIGAEIAQWVMQLAASNTDISIELVDLKVVDLPFMVAPIPPLYAPNDTEHGKAWAAKVAEAEGYIFVTPEYNHSLPAPLKNAIDYLATEWKNKPTAIISYGYGGGSFASRHLHDILSQLNMRIAATSPQLVITQDMFEAGQFKDIAQAFSEYESAVRDAIQELAVA